MKKIICFIIACLFLLTRSTDYTVKVDKINNVKNSTRAMIKLEILDVGNNLTSGIDYVDTYISQNFDLTNFSYLDNPDISTTTILNMIKECIEDIPQTTMTSLSARRSQQKEIDSFIGLINANYVVSNLLLNFSSYTNPFFINNELLGYIDLGFTAPSGYLLSTFETISYLVDLGVDSRIAIIFSGAMMGLMGEAVIGGTMVILAIAILIVIIILCIYYLIVALSNYIQQIYEFFVSTFTEVSVYFQNMWEKILSYLESFSACQMITINNVNYLSVAYPLIKAAEFLEENGNSNFYIITNKIDKNSTYWCIIPKQFRKEFIISNKIYDNKIFSTYTFLQSDAREAIFNGTTNTSHVVYHPYTDSTSLNLAMCHYHAVVNGEQKPPHSFFGRTFSNSSSQPIC